MKIAALILGILGGLLGMGGAIFAVFVGGVGGAFGAEDAGMVTGLGVAAVIISIVGLVGGALALAKPKAAGLIMIASAIGGLIAISAGYFIAGPLLLIAGILALLGNKNEQQANRLKATAKSEPNAL